jgi:hypothetical protein
MGMSTSSPSITEITVRESPKSSAQIINTNLLLANTEYELTIPPGTIEFHVRSRTTSKLQMAYTEGHSGSTFFTLMPGTVKTVDRLSLSAPLKLYFQSNTPGTIVELEYWTA